MDKIDSKKVLEDFRRAREKKKTWNEKAREDFEFSLGQQWEDKDVKTLQDRGVMALTINKIQPNIFLVSGIQRQNRTDFQAFPVGEEDSVTAEITTHLLKNAMTQAKGEYKVSEEFEDGIICGEGWIEPYLDYTYNLISGKLELKKLIPFNIFPDPDGTEYDLSDHEFIIKFSPNLSLGQLNKIFPEKEEKLKTIKEGKLDLPIEDKLPHEQKQDYPSMDESTNSNNDDDPSMRTESVYDLTEYYYKKYVPKYYVVDKEQGTIKETDDVEEADNYVNTTNDARGETIAVKIKRFVPEIWVVALVGSTEVDHYRSPFYPKWKGFPFIPYYAHRVTTPIEKQELMVQGIVRALKDPQRELNKRRTQELVHINQSANSGWLSQKGAWVDKSKVKTYGSSSGVVLEYNKGAEKPEKILPTPLSTGHHLMAQEATQDMKEISGINTDLLALSEENKAQSGRAIYLRQQQGMVMIQRIMDNLTYTKKILARFILSQLGEIYTVDTAIKVVGDAFIRDNFSVPVMVQGEDGQPTPQMDETGELQMQIDEEAVGVMFNKVLNDAELGKYDVAVGEGANNETIKYANYMLLMEMVEKGIPIPPEILIDESMLSAANKQKIKQAIAEAREAEEKAATEPQQ